MSVLSKHGGSNANFAIKASIRDLSFALTTETGDAGFHERLVELLSFYFSWVTNASLTMPAC